MKWLYIFLILLLGCSENNPEAEKKPEEKRIYFPYAARKEIKLGGENEHVLSVLKYWKLFESGNITTAKTLFTDSVKATLPSFAVAGKKDEVLQRLQKERASIEFAQCHIDFWQTFLLEGQPAVMLWAQVEGTTSGGTRSSYSVQQVWRFTESGLIKSVHEYRSQFSW